MNKSNHECCSGSYSTYHITYFLKDENNTEIMSILWQLQHDNTHFLQDGNGMETVSLEITAIT